MMLAVAATTTDSLTAWGTVGLAAVTFAVATLTFRTIRASTKARIDARAPLVTVVALSPAGAAREWLVDIAVDVSLDDNPDPLLSSFGVAGWFLVSNEGRSTAIVDYPAGVVMYEVEPGRERTGFPKRTDLQAVQPERQPKRWQNSLGPGEKRWLYVEARHPLSEWQQMVDRSTMAEVFIRADDTFDDGVRDTTVLVFYGHPVRRTGEGWATTSPDLFLEVRGTRRNYHRSRWWSWLGRALAH